jgi:hypothetical protein
VVFEPVVPALFELATVVAAHVTTLQVGVVFQPEVVEPVAAHVMVTVGAPVDP